uniref:Uncharacterized protein n=1 Tax=Anguilla anguilla TaxID=7936 RepID=A0A0E9QZK5_ANGAN
MFSRDKHVILKMTLTQPCIGTRPFTPTRLSTT